MMHDMKQALLLGVLILILGVAAFLYRATLEAPTHNTNTASSTVCTMDARTCPDGTSVGRTGPSCSFAACPLPNIELPQANISFALPAGYRTETTYSSADPELLGAYIAGPLSTTSAVRPNTIVVRRFVIPQGSDANAVMLANTMYETSGMQPESMGAFTPLLIEGKTYQTITVERFEAMVHVLYYLPRENDVLRFEAIQYNAQNWTDPNLVIRNLPAVTALERMLATLQVGE